MVMFSSLYSKESYWLLSTGLWFEDSSSQFRMLLKSSCFSSGSDPFLGILPGTLKDSSTLISSIINGLNPTASFFYFLAFANYSQNFLILFAASAISFVALIWASFEPLNRSYCIYPSLQASLNENPLSSAILLALLVPQKLSHSQLISKRFLFSCLYSEFRLMLIELFRILFSDFRFTNRLTIFEKSSIFY